MTRTRKAVVTNFRYFVLGCDICVAFTAVAITECLQRTFLFFLAFGRRRLDHALVTHERIKATR